MKNSIVNIESVSNKSFGTGFVIHSDGSGIYVLTCQHVLDDVVHPMVEDVIAKVVAKGDFIDMVVLYVSKLHIKAMPLQEECCHNLKVEVIGFSNFSKDSLQKEHIEATLYKEHVELHEKEGNKVYKVRKIKALDGFNFERGNSGSPVICKKTKRVIAMISNKEGSSLAYAVNIENLKEVWIDAPAEMFTETTSKPLDEIVSAKLEPVMSFIFPWKKFLLALALPLVFFVLYQVIGSKELWIEPEESVCIKYGGKVDGNGFCYAQWHEASEICLASKGVLPSLPVLKKVVTDCKGILGDARQEKNRINTINCFKEKEFLIGSYWSGTFHDEYYAWAVDFGTGTNYVKYKHSISDKSHNYVRCEKVED